MNYFTRILLFVADICFLNLSFSLIFKSQTAPGDFVNLIYLVVYSNLAWLFLVLVANPYAVTKNWTVPAVAKRQLMFIFIHLLVIASLVVFFQRSYTVGHILVIYLIFIPLFFSFRLAVFYIRRIVVGDVIRNYVIIGDNELAIELRRFFLQHPEEGYRYVETIAYNNSFLGKLQEVSAAREIQQVFFCVPDAKREEIRDLINYGLNSLVSVKIVIDSSAAHAGQRVLLREDNQTPGMEIPVLALDESQNQFVKRVFDIVFSLFFIVFVLSWLLPLIAILIRVDSRGPVFYSQLRNGRSNTPFRCIKFRTMVTSGDRDFKQATRDDERITRFGKFLRKSSIDEFPQFINVLLGDMSVIGPRPHPVKLNEQFLPLISNLMSRHYVKPGITGLAQCMGYRGETRDLADMENRIRLDRFYIENWSFWLDVKIIVLTVVSLVRGSEKAY